MNIGTATAPLANGVDDVNHANASGTAAVNIDSSEVNREYVNINTEVRLQNQVKISEREKGAQSHSETMLSL
jgi:hypothetical protein